MNQTKKDLLRQKLAAQAKRQHQTVLGAECTRIRQEITDFDAKYQFADAGTVQRLEQLIQQLDFSSPAHLNPQPAKPVPHGEMFLCFLCGTAEMMHLYIHGCCADFMRDLDDWTMLSPYLLLIDADFSHYIYIRDDGSQTEARLPV